MVVQFLHQPPFVKMTQFLDLPAELRTKILEYVTDEKLCKNIRCGPEGETRDFFITPWAGIAQANKQMSVEVAALIPPVLYGVRIRKMSNKKTRHIWSPKRQKFRSRPYCIFLEHDHPNILEFDDLCRIQICKKESCTKLITVESVLTNCEYDEVEEVVWMSKELGGSWLVDNVVSGRIGQETRKLILEGLGARH